MQQTATYKIIRWLLLAIFLWLNLYSLTKWILALRPIQAPLLWFSTGLCFTAALWFFLQKQGTRLASYAPKKNGAYWSVWLLFLTCIAAISIHLQNIFELLPVTTDSSDIIPAIQHYCRRFVGGEEVYQTIHFKGYDVYPNYLTMLWLPFVLSELVDVDYRWIGFLFFAIWYALHVRNVQEQAVSFVEKLIKTALPLLALYPFLKYAPELLGHSVELLIMGFYGLLAWGILREDKGVLLMGLLFCLLSRYAFVLWLPLFGLVYLHKKGWGESLSLGVWLGIGVLVFLGPYLYNHPDLITRGMKEYQIVLGARWQPWWWQKAGEAPQTLTAGYGLAIFFYKMSAPDFAVGLKAMIDWHKIILAVFVILSGVAYFLKKEKMDYRLFLISTLSMYLLLFYAFIQAPYPYLFLVPVLMFVVLFSELRFFGETK